MENNTPNKNIDLNRVSHLLDRFIAMKNGEMITKGFVPSGIRKGLEIYVRSGDHNPDHFHIESKQRNYEQKFTIDSIENISTRKDHRYDSYVKRFFIDNPALFDVVRTEFNKLNPELKR